MSGGDVRHYFRGSLRKVMTIPFIRCVLNLALPFSEDHLSEGELKFSRFGEINFVEF